MIEDDCTCEWFDGGDFSRTDDKCPIHGIIVANGNVIDVPKDLFSKIVNRMVSIGSGQTYTGRVLVAVPNGPGAWCHIEIKSSDEYISNRRIWWSGGRTWFPDTILDNGEVVARERIY